MGIHERKEGPVDLGRGADKIQNFYNAPFLSLKFMEI